MRKLLLFLFICVCTGVYAQRVDKQGEEYDYYCQVYVDGAYGRIITMNTATLEFFIYKDDGEKESFINDTALLTYMSKRGWCYVDRTDARISGSINNGLTSVYLMKKRVRSDEDAMIKLIIGTRNGDNIKKENNPNMLEYLREKGLSSGSL